MTDLLDIECVVLSTVAYFLLHSVLFFVYACLVYLIGRKSKKCKAQFDSNIFHKLRIVRIDSEIILPVMCHFWRIYVSIV